MSPYESDHDDGFVRLSGGGELAYQIHGREHGGIPALLIRPLGGSMALWGTFRSVLAQKMSVISFDLCGTGHSSPGHGWVTTQGLADESLQLLTHLDVARAHVFGISLGGMAATWLAILAPDRIARLCIASAPARGLELSRAGLRRELGLAACFVRPSREVESTLVRRILSRHFRETEPAELLRIELSVQSEPASRSALLKHALAGFLHDARRELGSITAPTLVLAGENDTLLGTEPCRALASSIPGARFEIIEGSGHALTLERPLTTASSVSQFFLSHHVDVPVGLLTPA